MSTNEQLGQIQAMMHELIRVVGNTNSMVAEHTKRFDALEGRFDDLEGKLYDLEGRFDALEVRFDNLDSPVAQHTKRFDDLDTRLEQIERHLDRTEVLERRQDKAIARIDSIEAQVELLSEEQ